MSQPSNRVSAVHHGAPNEPIAGSTSIRNPVTIRSGAAPHRPPLQPAAKQIAGAQGLAIVNPTSGSGMNYGGTGLDNQIPLGAPTELANQGGNAQAFAAEGGQAPSAAADRAGGSVYNSAPSSVIIGGV
jgi:hypothetical protein